MNNMNYSNSIFRWYLLLNLTTFLLQGCPSKSPAPVPIASRLVGRWEWTKTVTPTRTFTPELTGYREELNFANDGNFDFVAFYRNDELKRKLVETRGAGQTDNKANTVLLKYGNDGYIKYYLKFSQDHVVEQIETSDLLPVYSEQADSVRHFYRYVGPPR
jgi:hypothetical protein